MGVYRKLAILTRGTLRYAGKYARVRYAVRSSTLPYFNFFLTGTVQYVMHLYGLESSVSYKPIHQLTMSRGYKKDQKIRYTRT